MRAVLCLFVLISAALACPCDPPGGCSCKNKPKICNPAWNVRTFDSQQATTAFQGGWYLQLFSPFHINGGKPLKCGLFSPQYPCANLKVMFNDTTPCNIFDYNANYVLTDISYNVAIQRIEITKSLFMAAYGSKSPWAIFNIGAGKYYNTPITEINPFTDDLLIRHKCDDTYETEYTLACIGSDELWQEYVLFVLINQYNNFFNPNDNRVVWVFTRSQFPTAATYKKVYDDLRKSGINPYYLMKMDQSIDFSDIPTVNPNELYGITSDTVTTSSSTTSPDGTTMTSSSTTTVTTVSTVNFLPNPNYISPYEFDTYPLCGDIKILKNLSPDVMTQIFSNKYYLRSTMPCRYYGPNVDARPGLLNTAFPSASIQTAFDHTNKKPWDYTNPRFMIDRGVNVITGKTHTTRSIITSCFDGSHPYHAIMVYTEGYCTDVIEDVTPLTLDGMTCKSPGSIYIQQYVLCIAGFQENGFVIFYLANKYKNMFSPNSPVNPLYVMTLDRFPSSKVIEDINQEMLRIGYDTRFLTNVDQTLIIDDEFIFDRSYFYPDSPSSGPGGQSPTIGPTSLPSGPGSLPSGPGSLPSGPGSLPSGPESLPSGPRSLPSGPRSLPSGPRSLPGGPSSLGKPAPGSGPTSPMSGLPSYFPPQLKVKTFDSQAATKAFQGGWHLQLYSPTCINNAHPLRTGLFYPQFPCNNLRIMINDTTSCDETDYNTDFVLTDISFNMVTQRIDITRSLLKAAYGNKSPLAIFNVGTTKYFKTPIIETNPFTDDLLIRHKIDSTCDREYTIACIGGDELWGEYVLFILINQYDNFYNTNDNHIIWMFTRSIIPSPCTYKKAFEDLKNSGINPYYLMSMDQSIDFSKIPTVNPADLYGVTTETVTKSSSNTSPDGTKSISSSTTTVTTVSTVDYVPNPNYVSPYEFDTSLIFGDIKYYKDLQPEVMTEIFSARYYLRSTMPCRYYGPDVEAKPGLLNTAFPSIGNQVAFDNTNKKPWDYTTPRYMIDRAMNAITGETHSTRSIVMSCFDGSHPYNTIVVYTEGYGPNMIEETSPLTLDGMICKSPGKLYIQQYIISIVGFQKGEFVIFYIANKFKNLFNPTSPFNPLYVMTNKKNPSAEVIENIHQSIHRCGYDSRYLSTVDQTVDIDEEYVFESSYFEMETVTSSCGGTTVTKSVSSSTVTTVC